MEATKASHTQARIQHRRQEDRARRQGKRRDRGATWQVLDADVVESCVDCAVAGPSRTMEHGPQGAVCVDCAASHLDRVAGSSETWSASWLLGAALTLCATTAWLWPFIMEPHHRTGGEWEVALPMFVLVLATGVVGIGFSAASRLVGRRKRVQLAREGIALAPPGWLVAVHGLSLGLSLAAGLALTVLTWGLY